jgi:short-subunit dehydrogenase
MLVLWWDFCRAPYQGICAATKHALEGYSESLDHEVRQFGVRVSLIEPGFTRTGIDRNRQLVRQPLAAYANERNRVVAANPLNIAGGEDPSAVASVVFEAITSSTPRLRYPAGRQAKQASRLRKFAPARLFDRGLHKQFGLGTRGTIML